MRQTKCKRVLDCVLTDMELIQRAKTMSQTMNKKVAADDKLKSATTQIKAEIAQLESEIKSLQVVVSSGKEFREIECKIDYDWDKRIKSVVRTDTGVIVEEDIIPESELQEHFKFLEDENKAIMSIPENEAEPLTAPIGEAVGESLANELETAS